MPNSNQKTQDISMSPEAQRIAIAEVCGDLRKMNRLTLFMKKVNKTNSCWLWTGARSGSGYGQFWDGSKIIQAHHFLLSELVPANKEVCHTCDNKLCVNPEHLFIGTRSDNMKDCVVKDRLNPVPGCYAMLASRNTATGSRNGQSKLTDEQVAEIKATPRVRGSGRKLAVKFCVTEACISAIRQGVNRA